MYHYIFGLSFTMSRTSNIKEFCTDNVNCIVGQDNIEFRKTIDDLEVVLQYENTHNFRGSLQIVTRLMIMNKTEDYCIICDDKRACIDNLNIRLRNRKSVPTVEQLEMNSTIQLLYGNLVCKMLIRSKQCGTDGTAQWIYNQSFEDIVEITRNKLFSKLTKLPMQEHKQCLDLIYGGDIMYKLFDSFFV